MRIVRSVAELIGWRTTVQRHGVTIGFVPTMGALHAGHRSLIRAARLSSDAVVVSLFVNPTQFDQPRDLARYPRRPHADKTLCEQEGVDLLFIPNAEELYPAGFQTTVTVRPLTRRWEGQHRPGHFDGVATVLSKLFSLVRPHRAFFGQKDYQQCIVVRRLVQDLNLGVEIDMLPTVRERDGLAMSSRNARLTRSQRQASPSLYAALQAGEAAIRDGIRSTNRIRRTMQARLAREPLIRTDYLAVCDPETLEPVNTIRGTVVLLGAISIGTLRLIDNLVVSGGAGRRNFPPRTTGGPPAVAVRVRRHARA
jgi:pantoate--beta-alanine ligase